MWIWFSARGSGGVRAAEASLRHCLQVFHVRISASAFATQDGSGRGKHYSGFSTQAVVLGPLPIRISAAGDWYRSQVDEKSIWGTDQLN